MPIFSSKVTQTLHIWSDTFQRFGIFIHLVLKVEKTVQIMWLSSRAPASIFIKTIYLSNICIWYEITKYDLGNSHYYIKVKGYVDYELFVLKYRYNDKGEREREREIVETNKKKCNFKLLFCTKPFITLPIRNRFYN